MDMRVLFLRAVVGAVILLGIVLVVQITTGLTVPLTEGEIGYFNLLIDIVVGIFTIWGLYWVASELALKPDLNLILGKETEDRRGIFMLASGVDALIGRDISREGVSQVVFSLYLQNTRPKMARYIRIDFFVRDVPPPKSIEPVEGPPFPQWTRWDVIGVEGMDIRFPGDVVVHGGTYELLARVKVNWPLGTRPERLTVTATIYSLEGGPKEVSVCHPIHWVEEAA